MAMMDEAIALLSDRAVQAYFLILGLAVHRCIKIYYSCSYTYKNNKPAPSTSTSTSASTSSRGQSGRPSILPLLLSAIIISITWFLILRFILKNLHTSTSYFDDAYKDVLRFSSTSTSGSTASGQDTGHYFTSTQLLTWAIVAVLWVASMGQDGDVAFLFFGFLGAMGAAFVVWVPTLYHRRRGRDGGVSEGGTKSTSNSVSNKQAASVPITYAITSIIGFVSILQIRPCDPNNLTSNECTPEEGFGTFHPNFRHWLQCLHVILVAPIFFSFLMPSKLYSYLPRIPSCILFGVLAIGISIWHLYQITKEGAAYTIPITDCQISITTDLVCCSCITLYAIYKDSIMVAADVTARSKNATLSKGADSSMASALTITCMAAIIMPLISPAAVLAMHLCSMQFGETYASFIAGMQQRVASKLREKNDNDNTTSANKGMSKKWCNLGLWTSDKDDCSYSEACENLANALGKAAKLDSSDGVLCCGCGSMDEVRYYKETFGVRHVTGIDPHLAEGRATDADDYNVRTIRASVEDLAFADEGENEESSSMRLFPPRIFDKILALDNIYHYQDKEAFFGDCFAMLPDGGKVAVSDIVLRKHSDDTPFWVKMALRTMGVQTSSLWSVDQYQRKLTSFGYNKDGIEVQLVGDQVFKGWSFLPNCLLKHLDYALIVATKPIPKKETKKEKKRIAIIGSGLAGLSSSHYLLSSSHAANLDVDIFEAADCVGLAGNTTLIGEQLVDVPARMACLGYYNAYKRLLEELDIPSTVVRTDSSFYGDDGHGEQVCHCYDQSSLVNLYNAVFVGGLGKLWQMVCALGKLRSDVGSSGDSQNEEDEDEKISFGEWLQINLGMSKEATYTCNKTGEVKPHDLPSLTCHSNPFVYIMAGSLSWMLSCTWADLLKYPADIVLPYCRGLRMDKLGVGRGGQVIRIVPSIKVLERAMLYGVRKLQLNSRVAAIDDTKVINGVEYDVVIVATEAKAVPKVLKNPAKVFDKIAYHPSTIYIHTDESFMPPNKKDWKCWNVEMSSGRKEPQLTFWLNEFYPAARFDTNVFQTWAPTHVPLKEKMIRRSDFERVVHTKDTRSFVADIEEEQGKDGIYYAGSYCVYGMGLLEQALISGKVASDKILSGLHRGSSTPLVKDSAAPVRALVIGAGPSGLVAAKYLLESTDPIYDVTIVESSREIGGSFSNKVYDKCRLVSSKYLTAFSDYRMPEETKLCPDHPGAAQYVAYLESYAEEFGLRERIKFDSKVVSINDAKTGGAAKDDSGGYNVQYQVGGDQIIAEHYDAVAVCSGLHNTPYIPEMFASSSPNNESEFAKKFKGQIIHSSEYKDSTIFANKRVLILGCGETAMDIAHRAISNPQSKSVALSVRRGFLSIPHNLAKDRPLDVFITNLFEHAYEHPWVHALRLRWVLSTVFIRLFLFLTGSGLGFNQWAVHTYPVKRGYHIINKSHAAMGHLNVPIKRLSLWGRFWMWAYGENDLRPIESFHLTQVTDVGEDGATVRFGNGRTYEADLIVLATGYKQSFPFLDSEIQEEFREESLVAHNEKTSIENMCKYNLEEDYLPSEHFIVGKARSRLGFIGFVRPNVGAIPPMSELQVMWWLEKMRGKVKMLSAKPGPPSYMILGRKYSYGVDYGNYMHRVAEDFDAAPTLSTLSKSSHPFRALYTYCIGQSMISLFRLQGPYKSKVCWNVVNGELWRVCLKRGLAENCGLIYMTWLSLLMNLAACVLECVWCFLTLTRPKFFVRY